MITEPVPTFPSLPSEPLYFFMGTKMITGLFSMDLIDTSNAGVFSIFITSNK